MSIIINQPPEEFSQEMLNQLSCIHPATAGHYVEEGFPDPQIRRMTGNGTFVGRAITVRITPTDSSMVHYAAGKLMPGDVLLIDTGGDAVHAPVGEVVALQTQIRQGLAIVIDGAMTDIDEISDIGLPVYARVVSSLTTKLQHIDIGGCNVPIVIGGCPVTPGDVVVGDATGLFIAPPAKMLNLVDTLTADDASEPELIEQIRCGMRLGDLTQVTQWLEKAAQNTRVDATI